jgi:hypothetical protein
MGQSFWQKDSLITHILFELCLFRNLAQCTFFLLTIYLLKLKKTEKAFSPRGCTIIDEMKNRWSADDCLMTADCQMTAWWWPVEWLTNAWRNPEKCLTNASWVPDECLTDAWQMPDECIMNDYRMSNKCPTNTSWMPKKCLTNAWGMPDDFKMIAWHLWYDWFQL